MSNTIIIIVLRLVYNHEVNRHTFTKHKIKIMSWPSMLMIWINECDYIVIDGACFNYCLLVCDFINTVLSRIFCYKIAHFISHKTFTTLSKLNHPSMKTCQTNSNNMLSVKKVLKLEFLGWKMFRLYWTKIIII